MKFLKRLSLHCFLLSAATLGISLSCFSQTAPTALSATMVSNTGFEARWIPIPAINNYQLQVSTDPNFADSKSFFANIAQIPSDNQYFGPDNHLSQANGSVSYTVPQLSPSTKYYYRVRPANVIGFSDSNVIDVTTAAHPPQVAPLSWVKTVDNPNGVAEVQSMIGDGESNVYAAGRFANSIVIGTKTLVSKGAEDMFIVKLTMEGNVLWAVSIGGAGNDGEASLAIDSTGLYVVGIFRNSIDMDPSEKTTVLSNKGVDPADGFYAKFKPADGSLVWAHQLIDALPWSPACIALDTTGVYISGYYYGSSDLGTVNTTFTSNGQNDIFFGKYDLTFGNAIWVKGIGGPNYDGSRGLDVDAGGVFVAGFFNGDGDWNTGTVNGSVDFDPGPNTANLSPGGAFFAKYSTVDGHLLFAKGFTGNANSMCNAYSIDVEKSVAYVTGNFNGAIDFGAPNFQYTAKDIGGFIGSFSAADGNANWVKTFQTQHFIHPRKIIGDNAGVYVSGGFGQSVNFDPVGSPAGIRTALFGYDNFMARYTTEGIFSWVKTLYVVSIAPAARTSDGYFLGGMFWNPVNFDPYQGNANITPNPNSMFIAKYKSVSPPFVPTTLRVSTVDTTSFTANWKSMPGATGYAIDLSTNNFNSFVTGYNGLVVNGDNKTISGLDPGKIYHLRVRALNSYGTSDNSKAVSVNTACPPKPAITMDITNETLTSSASHGNQWFFNGVAIPNAVNQTLLVASNGSYTVQVTWGGCKSEMSNPQVVLLTGITPLSNETMIKAFPNPATENIFISLENLIADQPVAVDLIDVMGRNVKALKTFGGITLNIDLTSINPGVFLIRAVQHGKTHQLKFAKN